MMKQSLTLALVFFSWSAAADPSRLSSAELALMRYQQLTARHQAEPRDEQWGRRKAAEVSNRMRSVGLEDNLVVDCRQRMCRVDVLLPDDRIARDNANERFLKEWMGKEPCEFQVPNQSLVPDRNPRRITVFVICQRQT